MAARPQPAGKTTTVARFTRTRLYFRVRVAELEIVSRGIAPGGSMPMSSVKRRTFAVGCLVGATILGIDLAEAETVVAAGHSVTLMTVASIDQVCHSQGAVTVNVLDPPHGGFIEVVQTKAYPNFNALNTRSRCNTLKLPATEIVYQSAGNYLGPDSVALELILPGGGVRRVRIPISVRPVTATLEAAPPAGAETVTPEPSTPATSDRRKRSEHRRKNTLAAHHHPESTGGKAVDHPRTPPVPAKDPVVNT